MIVELLIFITTIFPILVYGYIKYKYRHFPPGPTGVPILGYLPFLGAEPHKMYGTLGEKYGKIFSVTLGSLPVVILNDLELIKKAFKMDIFSGRPQSVLAMAIVNNGISFNEGRDWLDQRSFTLRTLKDLGYGKSALEGIISEELHGLIHHLKTKISKPITLKPTLEISILNTLWTIVAGERHGYDDPNVLHMHEVCYKGFIEPEVSGIVWFVPFLAKIAPVKTGFINLVKAVEEMRSIFRKFIDEREQMYSADKVKDFTDYYIDEIKQTTDSTSSFYLGNGKKNLVDLLINLFVAGSDTTSSTLSWAILYLLKYPKVLEKLQSEIDSVLGNSQPNIEDRNKMPYTEACIAETLRLSSIVPGALLHSTKKDTEFEGFFLPEETIVMPNLYHVHHDSQYWGSDVNLFNPERFLKDGRYVKNERLIPFGYGKRRCPAENLALSNIFIFLTGLLQNFNIEPDPENPLPSLDAKPGLVLSTLPYKIILHIRNNNYEC